MSHAVLVGSSHGDELSIDFTLQYPSLVRQLVLVGAVVSGLPYTDHFLNRGMSTPQPFEKNDVPGGLANWAKDKYLLAPGHEAAKKRLLELLTANPQDMTHSDYARATQAALHRLKEIRVPRLFWSGMRTFPTCTLTRERSKQESPAQDEWSSLKLVIMMYLEKPEEFSRVVITVIKTNGP